MEIHIHIHHHHDELRAELRGIHLKLEAIMATQAELVETLKQVLEQQKKTATEIQGLKSESATLTQRVADLEAVIASGEVSQELADAVAAVKAQAQVVDDAIPDVPTPPEAPVEG